MQGINAELSITVDKLKAFVPSEFEVLIKAGSDENDPYWLESILEVQYPLSLAPDKSLLSGRSLLGIAYNGETREKKVKIFANNDIFPDNYRFKLILFAYDKDGAIATRQEYTKELECSDENGKILQDTR